MRLSRQFPLMLAATFAAVVLLATAVTLRFRRYTNAATDLAANLQETVRLNHQLRTTISRQLHLVGTRLDHYDPRHIEALNRLNRELGQTQIQYLRLRVGQEERLSVERIKALQRELAVKALHMAAHVPGADDRASRTRLRAIEALAEEMEVELNRLNQLQLASLSTLLRDLEHSAQSGNRANFTLAAGLVVALLLFATLLRRRVLNPLDALLGVTDRIRRGDFGVRASAGRADELGVLARHINQMAESLAESYTHLESKVQERTRELQAVQQQLVHSAKMSAMGQLVSGVAHELNNPLSVIMGFAELARRDLPAQATSPNLAGRLEHILEQSERCRRIVAHLLQFARREESRREAVRLNDLVESVLKLREYELTTHNTEVVREYDAAQPLLAADPDKLQQLLLNLLNNAYDAIQESGRAGTIWVETAVRSGQVRLEIRDTGTGLPDPQRVFEPFYTTKPVGKGTGLGLSVCYGIVAEHGGEIRAENWERGARVVVTLPAGELPETVPSEPLPEAAAPLAQRHEALVVEDEPGVLELQTSFLSELGVDVRGVCSGEEAIAELQRSSVDLVISDVRLRGQVDGLKLYEWVRNHRPELGAHFVFVSGDPRALAERLGDMGAVPHLAKPFRFDAYSAAVRRALGGS